MNVKQSSTAQQTTNTWRHRSQLKKIKAMMNLGTRESQTRTSRKRTKYFIKSVSTIFCVYRSSKRSGSIFLPRACSLLSRAGRHFFTRATRNMLTMKIDSISPMEAYNSSAIILNTSRLSRLRWLTIYWKIQNIIWARTSRFQLIRTVRLLSNKATCIC